MQNVTATTCEVSHEDSSTYYMGDLCTADESSESKYSQFENGTQLNSMPKSMSVNASKNKSMPSKITCKVHFLSGSFHANIQQTLLSDITKQRSFERQMKDS